MSNDIKGLTGSHVSPNGQVKSTKGSGTTARSHAGGGSSPAENVKATDTVNMSDTGKRMLALEAEVAKMPVVNQQKVVQLKREIESGVYKVDPHKVAEKLLELERVLGVKK